MSKIIIDGEEYEELWTWEYPDMGKQLLLRRLPKVEKPVSSPLQEWQKAAGMYFFQGDDRETVLRNSNATANWLVDELEKYIRNPPNPKIFGPWTGNDILNEANRLIGRED